MLKIYSGLLKSRQKSSLNPFQSPMGSFDCHGHGILFAKNFIEKAFNFDFLERKYQKLALFGFSTPVFFLQIVSKLADFLYSGGFSHGGHESEGIF